MTPTFSGDTTNFEQHKLLFQNTNIILVPKKTEYNLRKYVPKALLKEIDEDLDIAVEKCLIVLSNLDSTYYSEDKWKNLNSEILHLQTMKPNNTAYVYTKVLYVLRTGTKDKGPMLEVKQNEFGNDSYMVGEKSKSFKLTETYLSAGLVEYTIKTKYLIDARTKQYNKQLSLALTNPICVNLIQMYGMIDLPSFEEIKTEGKKLIKSGYNTKKGKILTMRNKHTNEYWKDVEQRAFVEDDIEIFNYLTGRGYMIPTAGDDKSGGRVVDSFNLMPSWIRNMVTLNGKRLTECDYTALHPNIAVQLYKGNETYITHAKVAQKASIEAGTVKVEHLSFFNRHWNDMKRSPLFSYYMENEPEMMANIEADKKENGYKVTSKKMFKVEVGVMSEVIKILNQDGIRVLYIYDALMCQPGHEEMVVAVMNDVILKHGVRTRVKSDVVSESKVEEKAPQMAPIQSREDIIKLIRGKEWEGKQSMVKYILSNHQDWTDEKIRGAYEALQINY